MGFFKLGGLTFGRLFKKPETLQYPFQTKEPYSGQKGFIVQSKPDTCNLCSICDKRCPANAISVDRVGKTWSINHLQCVQCGYCVTQCPKTCLTMDGHLPSNATGKHIEVVKINPPERKKPAAGADKPAAKKVEDNGGTAKTTEKTAAKVDKPEMPAEKTSAKDIKPKAEEAKAKEVNAEVKQVETK